MPLSYVSKRASDFPDNPIRGLSSLSSKIESEGITVIPLNIGAPDTATPYEIRKAGIHFLQTTEAIRYGPSIGNAPLIKNICSFYQNRLQFTLVDESMIMITQGASEALDLIFYTVADQKDEILVPDPCYSNYIAIAYKYGVTLKPIETNLQSGFHLIQTGETKSQAMQRIERSITKKTKAILWSSPGNPTGAVFTRDELCLLLELAKKHNIMLIADEVYRLLTFDTDGKRKQMMRSPSILDVTNRDDMNHIIVLDSASKMISFCGARVGTVIAEQAYITHLVKQSSVRGCPSTISQAAVTNIDQVRDTYFSASRKEFKKRRDVLYRGLLSLRKMGLTVSPYSPEGAFYIVADLGKDIHAESYCRWLLSDYPKLVDRKETVFLTPMQMSAGGFYIQHEKGIHQIRIAYVLKTELLQKAITIIRDSLLAYKRFHHV